MVHVSTRDSWLHGVICCGSVHVSPRGRLSQGSPPFCLCPPLSPITLPHSVFPLCPPSLCPPPILPCSALLYPPSTSDRALEDGPGKGEGWGEFRVPVGDTRAVREPQPHPPVWKPNAMISLRLQISPVSWKPPEKSGLSSLNLWLLRPSEGVLSNRAPGAGSGETSKLSLW